MRFIVLGDLHYATYSNPDLATRRDRVFETLFRQVAAHQADLVFAIGDTTNRGRRAELVGEDGCARRAGLEFIRTTGNHDTDSLDKSELAEFFLGSYRSVSDEALYARFDFGPARFMLLDTSRGVGQSSVNWSGFVGEEQLAWLKNEVEEFNRLSQPTSFIVLGHHPIFATTQRSTEQWLNIANSQDVQTVFQQLERTPGLYICGHNHSNSLFGPDAANWYFVQAGAPLVCQGYRLLTIDEQGIRVETIDFDLSDPQLLADFEAVRDNFEEGFTPYPLEKVYGTPDDRSLVIESKLSLT